MSKENTVKEQKANGVLRIVSCFASNRCSDYDDECVDVTDHVGCWMGGDRITKNGIPVYTERADGYCPFVQHCN